MEYDLHFDDIVGAYILKDEVIISLKKSRLNEVSNRRLLQVQII